MSVPNTPNPVDQGNINNTEGSDCHWQAVVDDMADYDSPGGGAGPNWHSTMASHDHEWTHWKEDYLADCIPGANWGQANADIDEMSVPKNASRDAAAARTALAPRVTARFAQFTSAVTKRWNDIPDEPGGGGRGYAAGMRVLNRLIRSVQAYVASKGWKGTAATQTPAGTPPAPSPAPGSQP